MLFPASCPLVSIRLALFLAKTILLLTLLFHPAETVESGVNREQRVERVERAERKRGHLYNKYISLY